MNVAEQILSGQNSLSVVTHLDGAQTLPDSFLVTHL
jgi:hypothetical protein